MLDKACGNQGRNFVTMPLDQLLGVGQPFLFERPNEPSDVGRLLVGQFVDPRRRRWRWWRGRCRWLRFGLFRLFRLGRRATGRLALSDAQQWLDVARARYRLSNGVERRER